MISEPVCPGAVQVTPDGQCIVLGVDGQTIGGYPKIAQVIQADLDALGQLRPGQAIQFKRFGKPFQTLFDHRAGFCVFLNFEFQPAPPDKRVIAFLVQLDAFFECDPCLRDSGRLPVGVHPA